MIFHFSCVAFQFLDLVTNGNVNLYYRFSLKAESGTTTYVYFENQLLIDVICYVKTMIRNNGATQANFKLHGTLFKDAILEVNCFFRLHLIFCESSRRSVNYLFNFVNFFLYLSDICLVLRLSIILS